MWTFKYIAARTLIWLASIAAPVQVLPAESCGCVDRTACCHRHAESKNCCCRSAANARGGCCSAQRKSAVAHACCGDQTGQKSACNCGLSCQCGKSKPPQPTAPPVESNSPTEKLVGDGALAVFIAGVVLPEVPPQRIAVSIERDTVTALDRCVSLCRFTL